ncbi:MAG: hypothetical protein KY391_00085 [Actinobacteria bacterium]|nr:hypothetical protein [Actinomycetota bacterium]
MTRAPSTRTLRLDTRLIAVGCGLVALFAATMVVGSILVANGGNVTVLVRMAAEDPLSEVARNIEPDFALVPPVAHYDGVYYYAIALDPFATEDAHELIDLAAHRYGHPAYGWFAAVASFGQDEWIPEVLLLLSVAGLVLGAYMASRVASRFELGSAWAGLLVALNPGLLFAVAADLSEALSTAILAVALWFWLTNKRWIALPFLVLLCFFKFQLVLVPVGLGVWELLRGLRAAPRAIRWKPLSYLAVGPVLFALWQVYVHARLGEWPTSLGPELLSVPPLGFLETIGLLGHTNQIYNGDAQLVAAMLPVLVAIFVLFVIALVRALRFRNAIDCIFVFQALMFLALNHWNLLFPKELIRVMAIPAILLVFVLAPDEKARRFGQYPASANS